MPQTKNRPKCNAGFNPYGICGSAAYCNESYQCCVACPKDCNIRCGWIPEKYSKENK